MLPVNQSIQLVEREINPIQHNELSWQKQAMSVMQISNVQEQPFTSQIQQLNAIRLRSEFESKEKQRQREVLTSLMMIMLGQGEFVHFKDQIAGMGYNRANERFNNLELVSAAFRTQSALFCVKTHLAGLLASIRSESENKSKIRGVKDTMIVAMATFYRNGKDYYQLLDEVNSKNKNQPSEDKTLNKKGYAPHKKERAERAVKTNGDAYRERCRKNNLEDYEIIDYIKAFFHEYRFASQMNKIFHCLSILEIKEIVKTIEITQVAVSQKPNIQPFSPISSVDATFTAKQPSDSSNLSASLFPSFVEQQSNVDQKTEFKILREPVYNDFWSSLEGKLTKTDYIKKFYQFVYTNWNSDYESERLLMQKLRKTKRENDLPERYKLLLRKYLQKKLKANAIKLIYHILKLKELYSKIEEASGIDLDDKLVKRDSLINKINILTEEHYEQDYLSYQKRGGDYNQFTEGKLNLLEQRCKYISRDFRSLESYINSNIPNNLGYINSMLKHLKEQKIVTANTLELLNKEPNSQPRATLGKRSFEFSQEHSSPLQKKMPLGGIWQAERNPFAQSFMQVNLYSNRTAEYCDSRRTILNQPNSISFEPLPLMPQHLMPQQELFRQRNLSFEIENAEELQSPEFQAGLTSFEPEPSISALELEQDNFMQSVDIGKPIEVDKQGNFNPTLSTTQNTPFVSEYLESTARKVETDRRYKNIYYHVPSIDNTTTSSAEMTSHSPLQDNQPSHPREGYQGESYQEISELSCSSKSINSKIVTEFQPSESISQNEAEQAAFSASNDESNLSTNEEDESTLQDIFSETDLQTHITTELDDIDLDDLELLNSLDNILSEYLY